MVTSKSSAKRHVDSSANAAHTINMDILIDGAIDRRLEIRDYETALLLKWLRVSDMDEEAKDTHLTIILLQTH